MRGEPADIGAFDVSRRHADQFTVLVDKGVRSARIGCGALTGGVGFLDGLPDSVIPLADKSCPVLNVELRGFVAYLERSFMVAIGRGGQQVESLEVSRGEVDGLTMGGDGVQLARFGS